MPDVADIAQEISERLLEYALGERFRRSRLRSASTSTECIDCDEEIPVDRRRAMPGCSRCITCQEEFELLSHGRFL